MAFIAFTAMAAAAEEAAAIAAAEAAAEAAAQVTAEQVAAQTATEAATQQGITQATQQAATQGVDQVATQGINSIAPGGQPPLDLNPEQTQQLAQLYQQANATPYQPVGQPIAQAPGAVSDAGAVPQTINQPAPNNVDVVGRGVGNNLPPTQPTAAPQPSYGLQSLNQTPVDLSSSGSLNTYNGSQLTPDVLKPQPSGIESGWKAATKFMSENPMMTGLGIYAGLSATGALKPQNNSFGPETYTGGPLSNYHLAPDFKTYPTGPNTNIYRPKYAAEGGIMQADGGPVQRMSDMNQLGLNNPNYPMSYTTPTSQMANGGITSFSAGREVGYNPAAADYYSKMLNQSSAMPAPSKGDAGIFTDSNPNTRRLNAPDAALYYQNALANRYGLHTGANLPKGAMGKINTVPVMAKQSKNAADDIEAAAGGIMQAQHYNLGGYASGGNPRLLRGPGDGMSDNIPATIEGSQPARLADGEFVVPADVVSGLGNGSTEAGAKHLHKMMDKVRVARTGNKAQGKQINPNKFTPK